MFIYSKSEKKNIRQSYAQINYYCRLRPEAFSSFQRTSRTVERRKARRGIFCALLISWDTDGHRFVP